MSHRSQSFPQFHAVSPNPTNYDSYGNVHGLPVPSIDRMPPHQPFDPSLPDDRMCFSDAGLRSRLEMPSSDFSAANSSSMRHFDEQAPLQPYDQSPELPSAPHLPTDWAHNPQRPFAHNHPTLSDSAHALDEELNVYHQNPEIAEGSHISSRYSSAQPAIASTSRRPMIPNPPANESDGLRFDSYANASSVTERLFRRRLSGIPDNDDVDDVERDSRAHVSSLVDALKRNDIFLPPPQSKGRSTVALTPTQKDNWKRWQESAQQFVAINLSQPHADELIELRAWDIVEEMIKIHRIGYRLTSQTTDKKSICSERIGKALQAIKDYAIVRKKLLEDDRISDFCGGPEQYASTTVVSLWNNRNRVKASSTTAPRNPAPQRVPVATGSVARRYQPSRDLSTKKRKAAPKSADEDMTNVEDSGVGQESQGAVPRSENNDASLLPEGHEREEVDDGSEADADFEWEEGNDRYALSGRQQSLQHVTRTRTEQEALDGNPSASDQDRLRYGNRSVDEGNSRQGRNTYVRPAVPSSDPSTATNTYGSGVPPPFAPEARHQFAATASDPAFPANHTFGGAIVNTDHPLGGMSTRADPARQIRVPSGFLSNTINQPTPGTSNAGSPDSELWRDLVNGKRTNKRRRL
jgi:hypothetical protein